MLFWAGAHPCGPPGRETRPSPGSRGTFGGAPAPSSGNTANSTHRSHRAHQPPASGAQWPCPAGSLRLRLGPTGFRFNLSPRPLHRAPGLSHGPTHPPTHSPCLFLPGGSLRSTPSLPELFSLRPLWRPPSLPPFQPAVPSASPPGQAPRRLSATSRESAFP